MRETFQIAKDMYNLFCGSGMQLFLYWCALLILAVCKKDKYIKRLGVYTAIFLFLFFFPATAYVIMKFCIGKAVYWRMIWLLPITLMIGYAGVTLICQVESKWRRLFVLFGVIVICIMSGKNTLDETNFSEATNAAKISDSVIQISETLDEYAKEDGTDGVRAIVASPICIYLRQYNGTIKMAFGRNAIMSYENNDYYNWICDIDSMLEVMVEEAQKDNYDYLVYALRDEAWEARLEQNGYTKLCEVDGYGIYKLQ